MKHPALRLICLALILSVLLGLALPVGASAQTVVAEPSSLSAKSAILMEAETETVLFAKNERERLGMASTTKIMTALLAAERLSPTEAVTVPPEAVGIEGSSVYLVAGERLTVTELLYALMLASANDAATALAIAVAGSIEAFADLMNRRAEELGLLDTHFVNPHGLYHEDHYTTAHDLARLSAEVLRNPLLRAVCATQKTTIPFDGTEGGRYLRNHNRMLTRYEGAIGLKTGFTKKTGRCLVSAAQRDGMTLVAVTLNAPDDWRDHTALLDYGFAAYGWDTLFEAGEFRTALPLTGGIEAEVTLVNAEPLRMLLPREHETPTVTVEATSRLVFAPVAEGDVLGTLCCSVDHTSASVSLIADKDAAAYEEPKGFWGRFFSGILSRLRAFFSMFYKKE